MCSVKGSGHNLGCNKGGHGAWSGMVGTNWHSPWNPKGEYWSKPRTTWHKTLGKDLALGMDHDKRQIHRQRDAEMQTEK